MWNEWLARTLKRPRVPEAGAMTRAPAPMQDDEPGMDDMHPPMRALVHAAQGEQENSLATEL